MILTQTEALSRARTLCRTLMSAPLPATRAREIFQTLARASGWSPAQEAAITAFGQWLETRPGQGLLKVRCEQVLAAL